MATRANQEILDAIHDAMAQALLNRIRDGSANAADLNVARQFLKDNGCDAVPTKGSRTQTLADELPDLDNVVAFPSR